mgnify:CR=1 FL=1
MLCNQGNHQLRGQQKRLLFRDRFTCCAPGCTRPSKLHAHHIVFRSQGGPNGDENVIMLCSACHLRLVHLGYLKVFGSATDLRFERAGGQPDITKVAQPDDAAQLLREYTVASLRDVLSLLILGAVALRLVPNVVRHPAVQVRRRTIPAVGWGLATFMLSIPLVIVVLVIGLIVVLLLYLIKLNSLTIIAGVVVLLLTGGMIGGFSFLLFFMGRVVVSYMIGQLVYRYALRIGGQGDFRRWVGMLAVGAVLYALLTNMPVPALGLIFELVTALAGVGAVAMYGRALFQDVRHGDQCPCRDSEVIDHQNILPAHIADDFQNLDRLVVIGALFVSDNNRRPEQIGERGGPLGKPDIGTTTRRHAR